MVPLRCRDRILGRPRPLACMVTQLRHSQHSTFLSPTTMTIHMDDK